ncbi:hypothetical protein [Pseudaestuariivita sp.]|uniref:hypothetical protein n=1 Tax=Pseudaestuariivita sp. TaxID=2211669 RepID=UPI0040582CE8
MRAVFTPTPGQHLYNALLAGFRSRNTTLQAWCNENGITQNEARSCAYGLHGGVKGRALRDRLVEAAGEKVVRVAYETAIEAEIDRLAS